MRIGEEFYPYIEYRLVDIDEKPVLVVACKESRMPCYLGKKANAVIISANEY